MFGLEKGKRNICGTAVPFTKLEKKVDEPVKDHSSLGHRGASKRQTEKRKKSKTKHTGGKTTGIQLKGRYCLRRKEGKGENAKGREKKLAVLVKKKGRNQPLKLPLAR